jgi:hypothetical protein
MRALPRTRGIRAGAVEATPETATVSC